MSVRGFDLVSEPWLPVLRVDGSSDQLSLREVFVQAAGLRRLVGDVPTQEFALLRLLLAIAHDAVDGPEDMEAWEDLWASDDPFAAVPAYLDAHRERFDLLHPVTPFFQVADLRTAKDEVASLNRIVADVPNGEPFFTMRLAGAGSLGFAEAARWVVHAHAFDTSGIKSGAVGDPRVKGGKGYPLGVAWAGNLGGVFVEGGTLRETLLLNLITRDAGLLRIDKDDRPAWRRPPPGPGPMDPVELAKRPSGPRDLYTWQSRRLRLHHDGRRAHGVVLAYGDPLAASREMHRSEPMTGWRRSQTQEKKLRRPLVYMPREHDPTRMAWRGLAALLHADQGRPPSKRGEPAPYQRAKVLDWLAHLATEGVIPSGRMIRARTISAVYGTQQSVIDEVVDDGVTMAVVLLHERDTRYGTTAIDAVGDAEAGVRALANLAADLAEAAGADAAPRRDTAYDLGFGTLDEPYRSWLRDLGAADDPHHARRVWQRTAHQILTRLAGDLLASAGPAAAEGRVVDTPAGRRWLDDTLADLRFRARLNKALPNPADPPEPPPADDGDSPKARP